MKRSFALPLLTFLATSTLWAYTTSAPSPESVGYGVIAEARKWMQTITAKPCEELVAGGSEGPFISNIRDAYFLCGTYRVRLGFV